MAKKLTVLQTFEQGMERKEGGVIKLIHGTEVSLTFNGAGDKAVLPVAGVSREIPATLVEKWVAAELVKVE